MTQMNQELRPTITCHQHPLASKIMYSLSYDPNPALGPDRYPDPVLDIDRDPGSPPQLSITCHQQPLASEFMHPLREEPALDPDEGPDPVLDRNPGLLPQLKH